MKECAYCGQSDRKITKEHVVNKAFLDEFYKIGVGFAKAYNNVTNNYLTIKDVCAKCNNEILSELDDYFLEFYRQNLPKNLIKTNSKIEISYDYSRLSRWLLKTIYNSERKNEYEHLERKMHRYKNYIINDAPIDSLFKIYVEILGDVKKNETKHLTDLPEDFNGKFNFLKLGTSILSNTVYNSEITKYFVSSNIVFHIFLIDKKEDLKEFNNRLYNYKFHSKIKDLYYLNPVKSKLKIKTSNRNIFDILDHTIEGEKSFIKQ
ncbi:hypothetical protein [Marinifilum flexuosum]|uniref:hypothetical protein n=1 Tax=Marinifilum flexuosum TaxID=1117708 RepID=UPI002494549A|nr:hypothetical protein [Marinifilum flexuosum]